MPYFRDKFEARLSWKPGFVSMGVWKLVAVIFLGAVFVLSAGFAKIMAMCVNWLCAHRLPKKFVAADKGLNLCLITAYPLVLVYGLGWRGPRIMAGGSARDIQPGWRC